MGKKTGARVLAGLFEAYGITHIFKVPAVPPNIPEANIVGFSISNPHKFTRRSTTISNTPFFERGENISI